jgi:hypothetical protein
VTFTGVLANFDGNGIKMGLLQLGQIIMIFFFIRRLCKYFIINVEGIINNRMNEQTLLMA